MAGIFGYQVFNPFPKTAEAVLHKNSAFTALADNLNRVPPDRCLWDTFGLYAESDWDIPRTIFENYEPWQQGISYLGHHNITFALGQFRMYDSLDILQSAPHPSPLLRSPVVVAQELALAFDGRLSKMTALRKEFNIPDTTVRGDESLLLRLYEGGRHTEEELGGEYAFVLRDNIKKRTWFSRTYLELYLAVAAFAEMRVLFWSSNHDALQTALRNTEHTIFELPAYHSLILPDQQSISNIVTVPTIVKELNKTPLIAHWLSGLAKPVSSAVEEEVPTVAIVFSGGLDSTVALAWAIKEGYSDITLLFFRYGVRMEVQERRAAHAVFAHMAARNPKIHLRFKTIRMDFLAKLRGSSLTGSTKGNPTSHLAPTWVPARNLLLLAMAASYCDRHNIPDLITGLNEEAAPTYPDSSPVFLDGVENALYWGTQIQLNLVTPLRQLMKPQIWQMGRNLDAPLHLTWSCYENGSAHCGKCGPCEARLGAAMGCNDVDPVKYQQVPKVYQEYLNVRQGSQRHG